MINLKHYINEWKANTSNVESIDIKKTFPKNLNELIKSFNVLFDLYGKGTEENPVDLNSIDVSGIKSFYSNHPSSYFNYPFVHVKFKYIDVSSWNVSNSESLKCLFAQSILMGIYGLENWDVSNIKEFGGMFSLCPQLKYVGNLSQWNVSNGKNFSMMFYNCPLLKDVGNLNDWKFKRNLKKDSFANMFTNSNISLPNWY